MITQQEAIEAAMSYGVDSFLKVPKCTYTRTDARVKYYTAIADVYEKTREQPTPGLDPQVTAAYAQLEEELLDQYDLIPIPVQKVTNDPYSTSKEMIETIEIQERLMILATGPNDHHDWHPMAQETYIRDYAGYHMKLNDVFRAVHDFFGHYATGASFSAAGEELAWLTHRSMMKTEGAIRAMTTETRGQNCWFNYGPHGVHNRTKGTEKVYAEQKFNLLPEWCSEPWLW